MSTFAGDCFDSRVTAVSLTGLPYSQHCLRSHPSPTTWWWIHFTGEVGMIWKNSPKCGEITRLISTSASPKTWKFTLILIPQTDQMCTCHFKPSKEFNNIKWFVVTYIFSFHLPWPHRDGLQVLRVKVSYKEELKREREEDGIALTLKSG